MQKVVVDTDIIIDYLRTGGGVYLDLLDLKRQSEIELLLSSVTVMELFSGKQSATTEETLSTLIDEFTVIAFDKTLAKSAGKVNRELSSHLPLADFIIGMTAARNGAKLATRNHKHFVGIPHLTFFNLSKP